LKSIALRAVSLALLASAWLAVAWAVPLPARAQEPLPQAGQASAAVPALSQADLDRLLAGADDAERAAARAQLAQAQANLDALRGGERANALKAAQAGIGGIGSGLGGAQ